MKNKPYISAGGKTNSVKKDITNYCVSELEIRKRRKKVHVIASHLINAFRIDAHHSQLVFVLSHDLKNNNFEALKSWVDDMLDSLGIDDYVIWNNALENLLNDAYI